MISYCSTVCCWHRRARIRVDVGTSPSIIRYSAGIYSERLPDVDVVFFKRYVLRPSIIIIISNTLFLATISQLRARKQHFKLRMFQRLQWILVFVVVVITIFFFVSSLTFSGRLAEGNANNLLYTTSLLTYVRM